MTMRDELSSSYCVEYPCVPLLEGDVVEIPLLLPGWQASVLERVAHQRGLTAGAMVRHLLHDFLVQTTSHCS
jgi:hypothetical protein